MTRRAVLVVSTVDTYQKHYHTAPMDMDDADELHAEISGAMQDVTNCPTVYVPITEQADATIASRCITSVVLLPLPPSRDDLVEGLMEAGDAQDALDELAVGDERATGLDDHDVKAWWNSQVHPFGQHEWDDLDEPDRRTARGRFLAHADWFRVYFRRHI